MSVFVCSGELIEYFLVAYSGMSLYAVILLVIVHCIFLYICLYCLVYLFVFSCIFVCMLSSTTICDCLCSDIVE